MKLMRGVVGIILALVGAANAFSVPSASVRSSSFKVLSTPNTVSPKRLVIMDEKSSRTRYGVTVDQDGKSAPASTAGEGLLCPRLAVSL